MNDSLNITIDLPQELKDRRFSPTFHTNLVWLYVENNDNLFPWWEANTYYDFGNNDKQEWFVDEILAHKWANNDFGTTSQVDIRQHHMGTNQFL